MSVNLWFWLQRNCKKCP